jgi:hypothetical protein
MASFYVFQKTKTLAGEMLHASIRTVILPRKIMPSSAIVSEYVYLRYGQRQDIKTPYKQRNLHVEEQIFWTLVSIRSVLTDEPLKEEWGGKEWIYTYSTHRFK